MAPEPEFLVVGRIVRPHGVRGEILMKIMTAYPERLADIQTVYLGHDHKPYRIEQLRSHNKGILICFEGIYNRDLAEELRNLSVGIHIKDAVPLENGEFYLFQIEGIRVITDEGQELGRLTDLIETGANDVYIVTGPGGEEILIPAIPDVIRQIDTERGVMVVHLLEGLL